MQCNVFTFNVMSHYNGLLAVCTHEENYIHISISILTKSLSEDSAREKSSVGQKLTVCKSLLVQQQTNKPRLST